MDYTLNKRNFQTRLGYSSQPNRNVARANDNWANIIKCWTPAGKRKRGRAKNRHRAEQGGQLRGRLLSSSGTKQKP